MLSMSYEVAQRGEIEKLGPQYAKAMLDVVNEAAAEIQAKGRADIAGAGHFGRKWTEGFNATVLVGNDGYTITTTMAVKVWKIFQSGGVIKGHPLLWIPLSGTDGRGVPMKRYKDPLVRVDRAGGKAPLMISTVKHKPIYFGKASVSMPKKFHLIEITEAVIKTLPDRFAQRVKGF